MREVNTSSRNFDNLLAKIKHLLPALRKQHHVCTLEVFGTL